MCQGLDYLKWLGIDAIWLSPTMPSPNTDWGYDVSDYYGVHPDLGTLEDLDHLIAEARARDIAVLLDLVPNHSSDEHPWFVDALTGRERSTATITSGLTVRLMVARRTTGSAPPAIAPGHTTSAMASSTCTTF